jgi:hypothetical protein
MRAALVAAGTLIGIIVCTGTEATPITWHLTTEVGTGNAGDFFFPFTVSAGDPVAIDFSYESSTPCTICEGAFRTYDNALTSITLTVHDMLFVVPVAGSSIGIVNDRPTTPAGSFEDGFTLTSHGVDASGISFTGSLAMQSTSLTSPVPGFDTVELANLLPPDPSIFADPSLSFWDFSAAFDRGFDEFGGRFLTASVTSVPEPAPLTLLASGTMLAAFFHYRRRSRERRQLRQFRIVGIGDLRRSLGVVRRRVATLADSLGASVVFRRFSR